MIIQIGEYVKFYFDRGRKHYPVIEKRAYFKEDALEAVAILQRLRVPIEGGGVFKLVNETAEATDTTWKVKRLEFDDYEEFLDQSYKMSLETINRFDDSADCRYLFELSVPFCIREQA
jgi:hypothetical protein